MTTDPREQEILRLASKLREVTEERDRLLGQLGEPVAEIVSGYSGDPDTRGSLTIKCLNLSDCRLGDKLYRQGTNP